jgi:hypothetical protein
MNGRWAQRASTALALTAMFTVPLTQSNCASPNSPTPSATTSPAALPPIRSAGDKALGRAPVRNMSIDDVIAEIGKVDTAGAWKMNKQWEIIINSLQTSEIPALLDAVEKMQSDGPRTALRHAFFSRWAETDPAAAMARALSLPAESLRTSARTAVIQGWAYTNPTEVAAWAGQLPEGPLKSEVNAAATAKIGNTPAVMIVFPGSGNSSEPANRFSEAAALDVKAAIAEAAKIPTSFGRVQAYNAIAKVWAANSPADAMKWALTLPDGNERGNERSVVGANISMAWARQSPRDANEFLAQYGGSNRQSWMIDTFKLWGERDFDAALAWGQKITDTEQRRWLLNLLLEPWLKRSPQGAADFVLSLPVGYHAFSSGTEKIVALWSANHPREMEDFLRRMTSEQRGTQAFLFALSSWLQAAPEPALQVALDLCSGSQRIDFATRALTHLAKRDVDAAKRKIDAMPDDADRTQLIRNVLTNVASENTFFPASASANAKANAPFAFWLAGKLAPTSIQADAIMNIAPSLARLNVHEALNWAKSLPVGPAKNSALQHVVRHLNESDSGKALKEVIGWPPGQSRSDMIAEIASRLAQKDVRRAVQLAAEIDDLTLRTTAVRAVVQVMSRTDPAAAIPAVMSLPISETRGALVADVLQNWAQSDATGAVQWAEAQTTPALRAVAFSAVISGLSNYSVTEAAALLEKIPPGERLDRAASVVCDAWCRSDPSAAARWAARLPPGNIRGLALTRVVVPFARADYVAAGAWLENLPPGLDRDRAIQAFLGVAATDRAAELSRWVEKIGDFETRCTAIETIARLWLRADADAANRWLATTDLPPERRSRLRPTSSGDYFR